MPACQRCYSRKTRCDRRTPNCTSCVKTGASCRYPDKRRDRQRQQEYLNSVELRLQELEREKQQANQQSPSDVGPGDVLQDDVNSVHPGEGLPESVKRNQSGHQVLHSTAISMDKIQRTPCEETRYLGSSNGVGFVDVVERIVETSATGGLFDRLVNSRATSEKRSLPVVTAARLVDRELAMPLVDSYFEHWHVTFPLLYRPGFMSMMKEIYNSPDVYHQSPTKALAFDMVLALGSVSSKKASPFGDTESHFARALSRLDDISKLRDIRFLQALLLYCKYGIHASLRDTSRDMWEILGKATRICVELGLHNDVATLPKSSRIVTVSLGRPLALYDDDIHVPLPSELDDASLDKLDASLESKRKTSPFLHHIRLRMIQAKIHQSMYTSRSTQSLSLRERQLIRRDLYNQLQSWKDDLELLALPTGDATSNLPSAFFHVNWYHALYHSGCLMLFRPSATFPAMQGLDEDEDIDDALLILWNSSRQVLANYLELLRARHLNYSWSCLYMIFMAGLANVYCVGCCAQRKRRGIAAFVPSYWDAISDSRDCSNLLTAFCERWNDARSSCDIFNILSMSALKGLAAVSFLQSHENLNSPQEGIVERNLSPRLPEATTTENKHGATVNAHQVTDSLYFPDTNGGLDEYPFNSLNEFDPIVDFQQVFQEMQNSIHRSNFVETHEVLRGFSQDWF
ncbi:fungal-specific transcription factor domain-containing protein [Penicillium cataractarum]|uniref:Fungal-specific transcription factor domain-containing protein n=1 Tax=Penicillium cataractarum TaxID=2100454 RepID=A0A9W9VTI3_9EURO|nr:fungal-specific transcription factor domain-containing protein [Penicillium cataractarum]KAJ5389071.1 fungal-specific transcription factor domain-containing protein [Penicillium cataractarum]